MWPTWRPRATSIVRSLAWGQPIPVYGDGQNGRDWLHVEDHCRALDRILSQGEPGSTYCIGGRNEVANIDLVLMLCALMDELAARHGVHLPVSPSRELITAAASAWPRPALCD